MTTETAALTPEERRVDLDQLESALTSADSYLSLARYRAAGWSRINQEDGPQVDHAIGALRNKVPLVLAELRRYREQGGNLANLGLATTKELIDELAARADVAQVVGEAWPRYRPAGDRDRSRRHD